MKRSEIKALFPEATKDQIDSILDLHGEGLEAIKGNYKDYVPKTDLDTVTAELTALKAAPKQDATSKQLAELERLCKFETDTKTNQLNDRKTEAIKKGLTALKAHPDAIELLSLKFDLNYVELDDKNEIKGFDDLAKPIQEQHSGFFGVEETVGAKAGNSSTGNHMPGKPENLAQALGQAMKLKK